MTATAIQPIPDTARLSAASAMHQLLPELVALALDAKQAHWNVIGPAFHALHTLADELAADTRTWVDRVAERAVALGFPVDARPRTVAAVSGEFPAGWVSDHEAITELIDHIDDVVATARALLADVEHADAVAHDLTVTVLEGLEKYRWMLRAQAG
jgi:starvation-inducible DNA-binding protein